LNRILHLLAMITLTIMTIHIVYNAGKTEESFTYFPTDQKASFHTADTSLTLIGEAANGYTIKWEVSSVLDRKAYLRQDISLLYVNGLLKEKIGQDWKQEEDKIHLDKKIQQDDSANFKAISFHHAELHRNGRITSTQKITHDDLYVLHSTDAPLHSFHQPIGKEDKEWKFVIDQIIQNRLKLALQKAEGKFNINHDQYTVIPLTDMYQFEASTLPGFNEQETKKILGRLWEGIYKNYFLGIKGMDGTTIDPVGSTIPLILIANDQSHLFVISELKNGEAMILRQQIPAH